LQYIADNMISLSWDDMEKFTTLLDAVQEDEDVDMVWHNVEM
jgi:transcriptional/translational regulatory protein YebC/TACO1